MSIKPAWISFCEIPGSGEFVPHETSGGRMNSAFNVAPEVSGKIPGATPSPRYMRFGPFHIDLQQQELFRDGARVRLQGKVCEALLILIENAGEIVTRETLRARLWPLDSQINYDANVNTTVNKLRQVLGDTPDRPAYVETIPRKGYTFIAGVEAVDRLASVDSMKTVATAGQKRAADSGGRSLLTLSPSQWFTAGAIALLIAGILFGAAVMLYAHRTI
jgi:DNA-binding winged helix-turn-helix (wHTH) protein